MAKANAKLREHVHYHRDRSVWARGQMTAGDVMAGYWECFRKDGTKMRSGYFEEGEQVGEWTTYDRKGKVVKVTQMKAKAVKEKSAARKVVKKRPAKKKAVKRWFDVFSIDQVKEMRNASSTNCNRSVSP